jgi:putative oxidoreductase
MRIAFSGKRDRPVIAGPGKQVGATPTIKRDAMDQTLTRLSPYVLSIVRIVAALLFFEHGTSRLFGWPSPLPTPEFMSLYWFAGAIELVGGGLLALGLLSRPAALVTSGLMAFAYFLSHAPHSFFPILNRGDSAILYCFIFFFFVFAGPGPWSLDALWRQKISRASGGALDTRRPSQARS